ncbi:putative retroelement protein [Panaeolus papilionaceus]|nr:putative retroelement protein [Panaeolus papilionaceus]
MKIDHSTWKSYASGFKCWKQFVTLHSYPLRPTPLTMSNFILYMSEFIKPSSVSSYLTAIIHFLRPQYPDVCEVRQSSLVIDTLHGCKRLHGSAVIRKAPLTVDMVRAVVKTPAFSFDDILFKTMIAVGFSALLRLGDISDPDDVAIKNPRKRALRSSVKIMPTACSYTLPAHKADKFFEGNTVLLRNLWPSLDIYSIFVQYLSIRDEHFPYLSPLWLTAAGDVPTRSFFISRMKKFNFGNTISGQSMRAGGATALAELGIPPHLIQATGRWSSDAWKIYIRKHPLLLAALQNSSLDPPHHRGL